MGLEATQEGCGWGRKEARGPSPGPASEMGENNGVQERWEGSQVSGGLPEEFLGGEEQTRADAAKRGAGGQRLRCDHCVWTQRGHLGKVS